MTIGEKIAVLREAFSLSQEGLAEALGVSRQSVSKWEMGSALPGLDKVLALSALFSVSTDTLLKDALPLETSAKSREPGKYFGTDGFRGEANLTLTSMQAYRVGRFLGWYFASPLSGRGRPGYRPRVVIGKDTRRSSYMLEYSIVAGLTASGADVSMLHVITTPGVSYVTRLDGFDCGIMITASHNPYRDNGIKLLNSHGEKLDDGTTALIEAYIDGDMAALGLSEPELPLASGAAIGCIHDYASGRNRYIGYLISLVSHSFKHLRIGLDCANGAAWNIAEAVFSALGASTYVIGHEPDGLNVNEGCGSTHIERLRALVLEKHLDLGFAFDGDADRCLGVDHRGRVVDGDAILYLLGRRMKARGTLPEDTVVATVMSNSGFLKSLERVGLRCVVTKVGDRFVYEEMQKGGYALGGEQSGHIIMSKYATTGDGILTALMIAEEVCDTKSSLASLTECVEIYPQYLESIRVKDRGAVLADARVRAAVSEAEASLLGEGRILLRESGTEPLIRVMAEGRERGLCVSLVRGILRVIRECGYGE